MRFIHLADLHIGKYLFNTSLLEIQADLMDQVLRLAREKEADAIVIAGDVFDRAIAPNDALKVFKDFLVKAVAANLKVLIIAGNHDGPARLEYLSDLVASSGVYLVGEITREMAKITIDEVDFYLLPFLKPIDVRLLFDVDVHNYNDAYRYYLQAQDIDYSRNTVLVAHQFFGSSFEALKENDLAGAFSVGNSEMIGVDLIDDFDYCALGHLHGSLSLKRPECRYGSSLMALSFDEIHQIKAVPVVTIANKQVTIEHVPLEPIKKLVEITGTFDRLNRSEMANSNDYVSIVLEDDRLILNARDRLKLIYPDIMQVRYSKPIALDGDTIMKKPKKSASVAELFCDFYALMHDGRAMDETQEKIVAEFFERSDNR